MLEKLEPFEKLKKLAILKNWQIVKQLENTKI